jgi:L,D-transpeptidase catalytic domain
MTAPDNSHTPDAPAPLSEDPATPPVGGRRRWKRAAIIAGVSVLVIVGGAGVLGFVESRASIDSGGAALAGVSLPPGATLNAITATDARGEPVAVVRSGASIVPIHPMAPGTPITVHATVHYGLPARWLFGATTQITTVVTAPVASLATPAVQTIPAGRPVVVTFNQPVARAAITANSTHTTAVRSTSGVTSVVIPNAGAYGTAQIAAAPRAWESLPSVAQIAWFAPSPKTQVIGSPAVAAPITPYTPLLLTYSQPLTAIPGALHAQVSQRVPGHWATVDAHTVAFTPTGAGFAPDSQVHVTLPVHTEIAGAPSRVFTWTVAQPSPARALQLLARLGYLPLNFTPTTPVPLTQQAQVEAIFAPPTGTFTWRWASTPAALRTTWKTDPATIERGAIMAFEDQHNMTTDGALGPKVWQALVQATIAAQRSTFGYTFVSVSQSQPERLSLWHNGRVLMTPLVNTGIPASPTASGVYPVYLRETVGTMSGTNPDGTKYHDPGIPWISYFNGGDALHGFLRGSYGSPQSLGCVEMPYATAGAVWPYTPIGTLVDVQ